MKKTLWLGLFAALGFVANSQSKAPAYTNENTLLWRVSGKNIAKPSYLFGTMHMLCADDIELSDSLMKAIQNADQVYLELDMDNLFEIMSAMGQMKMRNDTTLSDLLTKEEYATVKNYFSSHSSMLPFAMLETYKPLLAASMLMEMKSSGCEHMISMEQLIMEEAKKNDKKIKGLETMSYQLSIFDSIPYKLQAQQLVKMISTTDSKDDQEMQVLTDAYRKQQLNKMEELTRNEDMGIKNFTNLLLYNRNANWSKKLDGLLAQNALVVAVGAGHLPGEKGVISLLRKAGYKVEPVRNNMVRKKTREI